MLTGRYPIDVEYLSKGEYLPQSEVERLMGVNYENDHKSFNFALMELIDFIQVSSKNDGRPLLCCSHNNGVKILTDSEALEHRSNKHRKAVRSLVRTCEDITRIDPENLTDTEKKDHEREYICQSRILQAVQKERKKLVLEGYTRKTPLLESSSEEEE